MKQKYMLLLVMVVVCCPGFAQLIQASLGPGTQANSVKIYLKPADTQTPANISTLQFNIGIDTAILPKPVMTVMSTTLSGVTWTVTEATEGGYYNYQLTTATSPLQPNTTANTDFEVMEVKFDNGPVTSKDVALVTLPDGGNILSSGNSLFLCTGSYTSSGSNLYYNRPGTTTNNNFSYDENGVLPGLLTSTATISNILLPITWLDFSVQRQSNNALLQWVVANTAMANYYEIERSVNGRDFVPVNQVKSNTGNGTYKYADREITNLDAKTIFYRIKERDINGQFTYSAIRSLGLNIKEQVTLYPNPATNGFYIQMPSINPGAKNVSLVLRNTLSQMVDNRKITEAQATNYYFDLGKQVLQTGKYTLEVYTDGKLMETKNVLIKR